MRHTKWPQIDEEPLVNEPLNEKAAISILRRAPFKPIIFFMRTNSYTSLCCTVAIWVKRHVFQATLILLQNTCSIRKGGSLDNKTLN